MKRRARPAELLCLLALSCGAPRAVAPEPARVPLAITIDDLPFIGRTDDEAGAIARIVAAARAADAPITGFATCHRISSDGLLRAWDGVPIENHSDAHRAIDDLGIDAWRADTERCQAEIERITGRAPIFYRYPFLRTGRDRALRDASSAALRELSLRRAPVTIDTSDWLLSRAYERAPSDAIASAYVEHVRAAARRYRARAPSSAHVLLLHANPLLADRFPDLLAMLRAEGFRFVTLEEALADPIYARADHYAGGVGMSWLYRIEEDGGDLWAWDAAQTHALEVRFAAEREREAFDLDRALSIRRIADDTWIAVDEEPWPGNTLVARMPDRTILLVSTPYTAETTTSLLDWIRARFGHDVPIVAINPHFHPDGVGGNRALRAAGARTIGTELTARLTVERSAAIRAQVLAALADRPDQRARFVHYDPLPPEEIAEGELRFGPEIVRIVFPGPAHSPDNVVVYFPARGVVYGGCLIAARDHLGNVADANLELWPRAIERVRALEPRILVPGHGDRTDPGLLDHTLALLARP